MQITDKDNPPYHAVLLNDDDHSYDYVIGMLQELFDYPVPKGFLIAREVDATGRVIVLTTTKEHAELKRDQIHAFGADPLLPRSTGSMLAIIEPASETANHHIQLKPERLFGKHASRSKLALCPRCESEIGRADVVCPHVVCPHCGYDFPPQTDDWLSSKLGRIVLLIGIFGSGFVCLLTFAAIVVLVAHGRLAEGLIGGLLLFAPFLAVLIYLARVGKSLWI